MTHIPQMRNSVAPAVRVVPISTLHVDALFRTSDGNGEIFIYAARGDDRLALPVLVDGTVLQEGVLISDKWLQAKHFTSSRVVEVVSQEALKIGSVQFASD